MVSWDLLIENAMLATMDESERNVLPYGELADGAVAISGDRIEWIGTMSELPSGLREGAANILDAKGRWVTPGLIDCHTHLVFAGNRAREFEMRLQGTSYEEIARGGGGIASTVTATRTATDAELFSGASKRLSTLGSFGVTTVEVKSGYGLDVETELRMLRVARGLGVEHPVTVRTTFLGAHALAPEYAGDRSGYIDLVCETMIPKLIDEGLADGIDAFCEGIAFTPEECERVFAVGTQHGLPIRVHADQLSDSGGQLWRHELEPCQQTTLSTLQRLESRRWQSLERVPCYYRVLFISWVKSRCPQLVRYACMAFQSRSLPT